MIDLNTPKAPSPISPLSGKWVGYELHDGLLQWLVGARMSLEASLARSDTEPNTLPSRLGSTLDDTLHSLVSAIDEGRALISYLEDHSDAQTMDLQQAIRDFLEATPMDRDGQPIKFEYLGLEKLTQVRQDIGWNILRVVQQAVRNAIFHASPTSITVQIFRERAGQLIVRVEDDGCGFDVAAMSAQEMCRSHFGLASMHHRAQILGGELDISSRPGQGSTVRLSVPSL